MYDLADFAGELARFGPGLHVAGDASFPLSIDDAIESIVVPDGLQVTACRFTSGVGGCETYTSDIAVLPPALNDEVSYLLVEDLR